MVGICCGVVSESDAAAPLEPSYQGTIRRFLEPLPFKLVADAAAATSDVETGRKRRKYEVLRLSCDGSVSKEGVEPVKVVENISLLVKESEALRSDLMKQSRSSNEPMKQARLKELPKFGLTSVCGRRRDMEDAVSVQPWLCTESHQHQSGLHLFGVFDGHGCSHVAMRCKHRLHEIVKEEIGRSDEEQIQWREAMESSFTRMDREVHEWSKSVRNSNCRCDLLMPQCEAIGSTAVVALVSQEKIVVSNCGDSRAVLCRNGVAVPLSSDHKPDRPDELLRIQNAGGRVIYWDGSRVMGVLAMSRAIGDNYLKPYVIPDPEVTVTDRTAEDECLILASDGLWDVVSNETACRVARMCLRSQKPPPSSATPVSTDIVGVAPDNSDKACSDASILLTKLALARHSMDNVSVVVIDLRREAATAGQPQQP
ncbi:hypothetical protein SAY87_002699 [Trapa incisa]|uniref:protein-serine/threonine phosphatase n=1 Tax=Trapa incisa TaxID=236973 RepID=A0AAN7Q0I1_9MYRT|nr:hypothetical protein SAY87_002699 [Trapa incisa]